jgi:hypothetical protein
MQRVIAFDRSEIRCLSTFPATRGCDFCASDPPAWRYPARDVSLGTITHGSHVTQPISLGTWRACCTCSDLIEAGDWPALARRTLRSLDVDLRQAGPGTRVKLLASFRLVHVQFKTARNGPRVALHDG